MTHPPNHPQDDPLLFQIPPDMAPEDVLQVVVGLCYEMRHPLGKVSTLAQIINDPAQRGQHEAAAQQLQEWVGGLQYILNIVYAYDEYQTFANQVDTDFLQ